MKSLYCTADKITMGTGGGAVTTNELEALRSVSDVEVVLQHDSLRPCQFQQPDSPFLYDYFALNEITDKHFDLAHFYSGTFTQTVRRLKERGTRISYTVPAHDREVSIAEFLKLGFSYPFPHIKDDYLFSIFTEGYRLADVVIAPSKKSAEFLKVHGCKNVTVIPHGVDWPEKVEPIPQRFDVGYLGAVGPDKGLIYLIQGWAMLNYPDSRLILAGSGMERLEPFIRQLASHGQFLLMGRVGDVADFYNLVSVYVQPSVCEGFGIEIVEAMSYGRVVIASEGAGASELITNGVNGFTVPIRSPEAIADRINQLKSLPFYELVEMGQKARRKARNYTWDKIRGRYVNLFSSL